MARPLRIHIPGALYHVMSRGNARQKIFFDADDVSEFFDRLSRALGRFDVQCFAYCLMPNHFHLLLEPSLLPLSRMMQQLNSSYSQLFNRRHDRVGHVLQGRFKSPVIDRDEYFRRVLRYIVLNPVRAEMVRHPAEWPLSSYRATAGLESPAEFLTMTAVWDAFDPRDHHNAQQLYAEWVEAGMCETDRPDPGVAWGSDQFKAEIRERVKHQRDQRDIVRAERFVGRRSLDQLFAGCRGRDAFNEAMRQAFEHHGYTLREIGDIVGQRPSTIWKRIRRAAIRLRDDDGKNQDLTP